jgi:hypothetical protein
MDISEKYIKMCESAKDIQLQWNFKCEDYIFDPADGEAMCGLDTRQKKRLSGCQERTNYKKYA